MRSLMTRLVVFSLALMIVPNVQLKVLSPQNELEELKSTVASALPSGWSVAGAEKHESLFPKVEPLRDRYKGLAILLVGPTYTVDTTPKGSTERKTWTVSKTAEVFLIPVWAGISRAQLTADLSTAFPARQTASRGSGQAQQQGTGFVPPYDIAYGWNDKYLLLCKHDCEIVKAVAKKLKIEKR